MHADVCFAEGPGWTPRRPPAGFVKSAVLCRRGGRLGKMCCPMVWAPSCRFCGRCKRYRIHPVAHALPDPLLDALELRCR